jgi:hypothetical protein
MAGIVVGLRVDLTVGLLDELGVVPSTHEKVDIPKRIRVNNIIHFWMTKLVFLVCLKCNPA